MGGHVSGDQSVEPPAAPGADDDCGCATFLGDPTECLDLLAAKLLPAVNLFAYGQVKSAYGSGQFKHDLDQRFPGRDDLVSVDIADRDGILPAIRAFLGRGR